MHAVVCIKQVPDSAEVKIDPKTNTLMREGVPSIINPYDVHAIEEALQLKDKYGGKVTIISMGPPQAKEALKKAYSFGVDEAILVSDRAFAGADTLATSYVLAETIRYVAAQEPVDIVFCGKQAIDGDTAQVGPGIAARLGFPPLSYVLRVDWMDPEKREVQVQRLLEEGREVVVSRLPALLTMVKEGNEPRYASLKNLIAAARYEVPVWTKDSLGLDVEQCGLKGSPTMVRRIFAPPQRQASAEMIDGMDPPQAASQLVERLISIGLFRADQAS